MSSTLPTPTTDPGGLAAGVQASLGAVLVAVGIAEPDIAKWCLVATALVGLASQLWARAQAWPPAKVWLEAMAARAEGRTEGRRDVTDDPGLVIFGAEQPDAP